MTPEADTRIGVTDKPFWKMPHFIFAVIAQFLYVAGQTGIFSFFINYVVEHSPALSLSLARMLPSTWTYSSENFYQITERGASQILAFGGFGLFMHGIYHGEKVAFGTITQLILENAPTEELNTVLQLCIDAGLPVTLKQLNVTEDIENKMRKVAGLACAKGETIYNMPFAITEESVYAALIAADSYGSSYGSIFIQQQIATGT